MKLSEVFSSLLQAEDQAAEYVSDAKNEAERLHRKARMDFEDKRKTALDVAHGNARATVDGARIRGDKEAIEILALGESERNKITELFEKNVDELMAALANETAEEYVTRARSTRKNKKEAGE
jgi:vacuolar-type H+-ATPase subunit H